MNLHEFEIKQTKKMNEVRGFYLYKACKNDVTPEAPNFDF
jgi:hypothetical protein